MINGEEFAHEDIVVTLLGNVMVTCTAIEYTSKKNITPVMGAGDRPYTHGRGSREFEAKVTINQSDLERIQARLPRGASLLDIPAFDINVTYAPIGGTVKTDIIARCRFTEIKKAHSQGNGVMVVELPVMPLDIKYNV